ncbi:MAG: hypothetical protein KAH07_02395 [Flavobacteriaceae bacterium]|nr:hypothetical protein [Flavobacteriaceae bacterium]
MKFRIQEYVENLNPDRIKSIQNLGLPSTLIEGIDYTIDKNGYKVFSPWYLLRQGSCCSNKCTNCPYPIKINE